MGSFASVAQYACNNTAPIELGVTFLLEMFTHMMQKGALSWWHYITLLN